MADRIMIVEDEPRLREILSDYIRSKGDDPIPMADGIQALRYLEEHTVDALLLDILMPELDGFSVCRRVRQENCRSIPPRNRDLPPSRRPWQTTTNAATFRGGMA